MASKKVLKQQVEALETGIALASKVIEAAKKAVKHADKIFGKIAKISTDALNEEPKQVDDGGEFVVDLQTQVETLRAALAEIIALLKSESAPSRLGNSGHGRHGESVVVHVRQDESGAWDLSNVPDSLKPFVIEHIQNSTRTNESEDGAEDVRGKLMAALNEMREKAHAADLERLRKARADAEAANNSNN